VVTFDASREYFHFNLPVVIAIVNAVAGLVFNVRGIRSTVWFSYITGILLMIAAVMMVCPT